MTNIYVNATAAAGGDGTAAAPFQNLQSAVAAAVAFDAIHVARANGAVYDTPDGAPVRTTLPLDFHCEPGTKISAEFFFSGPRVEIRNAAFVPRARPAVDFDLDPWPQYATIMASPGQVWLTDCDADGSASTKPLGMAYGSSTLFVRARSRTCTYDFRGSQQMVFASWYGSYISPRGQNGNRLLIGSDTAGPVISVEGSHGYMVDTEVFGTGSGTGVVLLRGGSCVFSSSGVDGNIQRGRFRQLNAGIAASRKAYGHIEPAVAFTSVANPVVNATGASVVVL